MATRSIQRKTTVTTSSSSGGSTSERISTPHSAPRLLFWMVGCFLLGYMAWVLSNSITVSKFLSGGLMFAYSMVGVGFLLFLMGLSVWVAGASEVVCIIWFFLIMLIAGLLAEVSGIITLKIMDMQLENILLYGWAEVNQGTRNIFQENFKCCGFYGPKEFAYTDYPMDESCYTQVVESTDDDLSLSRQSKILKQSGCGAHLKLWFMENKATWCSLLACLGGLHLMCIVLCIHILYKLRTRKVTPDHGGSHPLRGNCTTLIVYTHCKTSFTYSL